MIVVGVTGRIGCGKSTLCRLLAQRHGVPVIDADALGHEALRDPAVRDALRLRFGEKILDPSGAVNRPRLADRVFADDPAALADLNAAVHPWIVREMLSRLAALRAQGGAGIVLIDAALLLDWKDSLPLDCVVVVRCSDGTAIARLGRRGVTENEARRRLVSQSPEEALLEQADFTIENEGDEKGLEEAAERLWRFVNRTKKDGKR